jgi:uncharacterized protein (TIGR04222 family)
VTRSALGASLLIGLGLALVTTAPGPAHGSAFESIHRYDVSIRIEPSGSLLVTETIDYDFGSTPKHGIYRDLPERVRYDDTFDRVYPIHILRVAATGASAEQSVEHQDGTLQLRIGDPDRTVTGEHVYTIIYRVDGALNGFRDHDELYWNAIGADWSVPIESAAVHVRGPAPVTRVACFEGPAGSSLPCDRARVERGSASFVQGAMPPYEALTVVVALPPGSVASTAPILEERWSLARAFAITPVTAGGSFALLAAILIGLGLLMWRRGRDLRYQGSPVDQVMGSSGGPVQRVPPFEGGEAPAEFAPPADLRPGQIGTLLDERAGTLDVTATIVDLAVRRYLVIEEIPKDGWFGKPDWKLTRTDQASTDLLPYERELLDALFAGGDEVELSSLRRTFHEHLVKVESSLYVDASNHGWFVGRPDRIRTRWIVIGWVLLLASAVVAFVLIRWSKVALLGLPLVLGSILLLIGARWMPRRTAKGTALTRRVLGFRHVIETAEGNLSRWAEQANVFTKFLPYAIVFGCTDKWAKAFEGLAQPPDTSWYVSTRPFAYAAFADQLDGFSVATSGTIAATPAGSGSSGFGGGGFSGGGGGGGGGGSW